jgi:hypothetical protein
MRDTIEATKYLASLAVFRELYDSEKDVYGILSQFIILIIVNKSKQSFSLAEITSELNEAFDFNIPEAVIKKALKRLNVLRTVYGMFYVQNLSELKANNINKKKDQIQEHNEEIIKSLFQFIEIEKKATLDDAQKEEIVHSFCSFLLDNSIGGKYSEFISGFLIKNKRDDDFKKQLNTIKEGVVLYTGIKYNNNLNDIGSWKTDMTIYLATEILFNFAGYDGELRRDQFDDFYSYVREINRNKPDTIKMKYFQDVKYEIESFFKMAEYITEGKEKLNPSRTAMASIVNGCSSKSDVVAKKVAFFQLLNSAGIIEDDYDEYFIDSNHKYNIVDQAVIKTVSESLKLEDITAYLKYLNFISIQRKEANSNNFDNIKCILLSENSRTIKIAWHNEIKKNGNVPLATRLDFLTNKFWFKLNKGFGTDGYPKSFDVITKAQIVLSSQAHESVGKKYDQLQIKFKNGELTEDEAKATIIELRKSAKKPEDIREEDVSSILVSISEESIGSYLREQEHFKNKANKRNQENTKLKKNLQQSEQTETKQANEIVETKEKLLKEKQNTIDILENQKEQIDNKAVSAFGYFKIKISTFAIVYFALSCVSLWKFGWDKMEPTFYFISLATVIIWYLYLLIKEKIYNPLAILREVEANIQRETYIEFSFDATLLESMGNEIYNLRKEIDELRAKL